MVEIETIRTSIKDKYKTLRDDDDDDDRTVVHLVITFPVSPPAPSLTSPLDFIIMETLTYFITRLNNNHRHKEIYFCGSFNWFCSLTF